MTEEIQKTVKLEIEEATYQKFQALKEYLQKETDSEALEKLMSFSVIAIFQHQVQKEKNKIYKKVHEAFKNRGFYPS